jgi:hypothetical protein
MKNIPCSEFLISLQQVEKYIFFWWKKLRKGSKKIREMLDKKSSLNLK